MASKYVIKTITRKVLSVDKARTKLVLDWGLVCRSRKLIFALEISSGFLEDAFTETRFRGRF